MLTFSPNRMNPQIVSFRIIDDDILEDPESFSVRIRNLNNDMLVMIPESELEVTIFDNDGDD